MTGGLSVLLALTHERVAASCLDSTVETTRVYWRRKYGLREEVVHDPRPLAEIVASLAPSQPTGDTPGGSDA